MSIENFNNMRSRKEVVSAQTMSAETARKHTVEMVRKLAISNVERFMSVDIPEAINKGRSNVIVAFKFGSSLETINCGIEILEYLRFAVKRSDCYPEVITISW